MVGILTIGLSLSHWRQITTKVYYVSNHQYQAISKMAIPQANTINTSQSGNLAPADGELFYYPAYLPGQDADRAFDQLLTHLAWQQEKLSIMGKQAISPRLVCWYGDAGAVYRYSNVEHTPLPWNPMLIQIKQQIEQDYGYKFNSVLGNLYRDGNDSMGWHADKENELGKKPVIASLSLGATRLFKLRHNNSKQIVDINLEHGSLLLMAGCLQHHWRHCLPKTRTCQKPRINLTFRYIFPQG